MLVKGHSGYLIVPIIAIPATAVGAFTYFRDHLPAFCVDNADKVMAIVILVTLVLVGVALFLRSRSVELDSSQLRYRSWVTDRTVQLDEVTAVTFETELSGGADQHVVEHFLTFWAGDDVCLRFNTSRWPREGLRGLVRASQERRPSIRLDLDVERYVAA